MCEHDFSYGWVRYEIWSEYVHKTEFYCMIKIMQTFLTREFQKKVAIYTCLKHLLNFNKIFPKLSQQTLCLKINLWKPA